MADFNNSCFNSVGITTAFFADSPLPFTPKPSGVVVLQHLVYVLRREGALQSFRKSGRVARTASLRLAEAQGNRWIPAMSKTEILQELPELTPEERQEVRLRLAELDREDWLDEGVLTDAEKTLIGERFREMEANPQTSIPWEEARARLLTAFKR